MSPDPPREDTGDDDSSNRIRRFSGEFMEGMMDDEFFIVPDAPYELDMEQESDYTDSDEDNPPQQGESSGQNGRVTLVAAEQEFAFQGQARGRYRLLIPFPVDNTSSANSADEAQISNNVEGAGAGDGSSNNAIQSGTEEVGATANTSSVDEDSQKPSASTSHSGQEIKSESEKPTETSNDEKTREIDLSAEKVETIKQVMKNITLPPQAIPKWASEVDEDVWRRKLYDTIDNKPSRNQSTADSKAQEETEPDK